MVSLSPGPMGLIRMLVNSKTSSRTLEGKGAFINDVTDLRDEARMFGAILTFKVVFVVESRLTCKRWSNP